MSGKEAMGLGDYPYTQQDENSQDPDATQAEIVSEKADANVGSGGHGGQYQRFCENPAFSLEQTSAKTGKAGAENRKMFMQEVQTIKELQQMGNSVGWQGAYQAAKGQKNSSEEMNAQPQLGEETEEDEESLILGGAALHPPPKPKIQLPRPKIRLDPYRVPPKFRSGPQAKSFSRLIEHEKTLMGKRKRRELIEGSEHMASETLRKKIAELEKTIQDNEKEIQVLGRAVEKERATVHAYKKTLGKELEANQAEITRLKEENETLQATVRRRGDRETKIAELRQQLEALKQSEFESQAVDGSRQDGGPARGGLRGYFAYTPGRPVCESCQVEGVVRTAKQGLKAGQQFWGCPNFFTNKCLWSNWDLGKYPIPE